MRKTIILAVALALTAAGCGDSEPAPSTTAAPPTTEAPSTTAAVPVAGEVEISIEGFAFGPQEITVPVGTTVTWVNDEETVPHTSTSDDGEWNSGTLDPGESFSFTFERPGTYPYICAFHPSMTGTIVVEG